MTEAQVEWHLWNWKEHHLRSRERGEGYPSRASGNMENYMSTADDDRDYETLRKWQSEATDSAIDDLRPIYREAVYAHDLGASWSHPEPALGIHYRAAIPLIGRGLDRRGVVGP